MTDDAENLIIGHFCEQRGLAAAKLPRALQSVIFAGTAPFFSLIECLDDFTSDDPVDGLLLKLLDRTYNSLAGSLALIAVGHYREAEILARSVFEGAATLLYIEDEETNRRFVQYFTAYVKQEREQNRKWRIEVGSLPEKAQGEHLARISNKDKALGNYEKFIQEFAKHVGANDADIGSWPNLLDRLSALGRRIDHRTVYAAMCSQAHHDAEDILNNFHSSALGNKFSARIEDEANSFSVFMVLFGLKDFVRCTTMVAKRLGFSSSVERAMQSWSTIENQLQSLAKHVDKGTFPEDWAT